MRKKIIKQRQRRLAERFAKKAYQVARIKQSCAEDDYNGLFTSDHIIEQSGFVDFFFIGKYRGHDVVYNACITTADSDYYDEIEMMAFDAIDTPDEMPSLSSQRDTPDEQKIMFDHYREHSEYILSKMNNREVSIPAWKVELDYEYKFGIGLHIRINKQAIEVEDIVSFIKSFNRQGTRVFDDKSDVINKTPEELGVSLADDDMFIRWDRGMPNVAALNI